MLMIYETDEIVKCVARIVARLSTANIYLFFNRAIDLNFVFIFLINHQILPMNKYKLNFVES